MKPILLIYATREDQAQRIADHLSACLSAQQQPSDLVDAAQIPPGFAMANYSAAIVSASLHMGKFEAEMVRFVKRNLTGLREIPTLFLAISLAQAGVEDQKASAKRRTEARAQVKKTTEDFLSTTGWRPTRTEPVAGALKYTKYGLVTRFVMRHIASKAEMPTDTNRDYEYTDWAKLDRLVEEFVPPAGALSLALGTTRNNCG